jgi:hypothetical protein
MTDNPTYLENIRARAYINALVNMDTERCEGKQRIVFPNKSHEFITLSITIETKELG